MQEFYGKKRQHLDFRAALVWDMQSSISERLHELGGKIQVGQINMNPEMAVALRDIHRYSMKAECQSAIPSEAELLKKLPSFRDRFLDFIVQYPDGKIKATEA